MKQVAIVPSAVCFLWPCYLSEEENTKCTTSESMLSITAGSRSDSLYPVGNCQLHCLWFLKLVPQKRKLWYKPPFCSLTCTTLEQLPLNYCLIKSLKSLIGECQIKVCFPFSNYVAMVVFFFSTNVINNAALNFNVPMPLHMIFRSVSCFLGQKNNFIPG